MIREDRPFGCITFLSGDSNYGISISWPLTSDHLQKLKESISDVKEPTHWSEFRYVANWQTDHAIPPDSNVVRKLTT
jgi:hypothetical protein